MIATGNGNKALVQQHITDFSQAVDSQMMHVVQPTLKEFSIGPSIGHRGKDKDAIWFDDSVQFIKRAGIIWDMLKRGCSDNSVKKTVIIGKPIWM